jgi:hypothetical protein
MWQRHPIAAGCGRIMTTTRILRLPAVIAPLLGLPSLLAAQIVVDSGTFVVRHGKDTVAIERFTREATRLEGTLAILNSKRTSHRYTAVIGPDATLPLIEMTVREGVDSGPVKPKVVKRARVIFKGDSAAVDEVGDGGLMTRVLGTDEGAVPYLNLSFALLEQAVRRARAIPEGSQVSFFNLGGGQSRKARVSPLGRDSLKLDIGNISFHLRVDTASRVLGGRIPAQDVVAERR